MTALNILCLLMSILAVDGLISYRVGQSRRCYYDFTLELYYTLAKGCYDCPHNKTDCYRPHCVAADGVQRAIYTVNRMLPGPAIHVCENDTVIVNVHNDLNNAEGTSIHWHGVLQHGSQHMDGVAMVTQCPIAAKTEFEYRFKAANAGTHFWHAHSGLQRSDGLYGAFVIRQADEHEPHLGLYDEDLPGHTMIVNDWLVELAINRFANHHNSAGDNKPRSMLINGKGVLQEFFSNSDNTSSYTPVHVFQVTQGRRFRFRTISNGILNCPIQVSIDNHTMTMIASDGNAFEKVEVESFNIFAGERYDFVLGADKPVGNYWVRVRGLADCGVKSAHQVAILRYDGADDIDPPLDVAYDLADRGGKKLNPWNKKSTEELVAVADLKARNVSTYALQKTVPDKTFYLAMDFNMIDNYHFNDKSFYPLNAVDKPGKLYTPQINHISLVLPHTPPLTQLQDIPEGDFCSYGDAAAANCSSEYCECVYRLQVALGDVVELVVIDEGVTFNANHPMHLHGHAFHVLGMDRLNESTSLEEIQKLDGQGLLPRFWFFHCHIEFHVDIGMGMIIQVGDQHDMPKVPTGFPKCGHWSFSGYGDAEDYPSYCVGGASRAFTVSISSFTVFYILYVLIS
ncbi:LAC1-like protein [Mya arenaria]|uniref:LAC1-like protein n=1 Tax=Mya arenaria TaxID=6604 RepID=A0ABY7DRH8_MYAAR|nr:LAC1-like protein [Mya arenaria]